MATAHEIRFTSATDDDSRAAILTQVAADFWHSKDKEVTEFLARAVLDETYSRDVRLIAYIVLFEVCDRDLWQIPPLHEFRVPENFDLPFLGKCAKGI
jgi:hypothetical protein